MAGGITAWCSVQSHIEPEDVQGGSYLRSKFIFYTEGVGGGLS